MEAFLERYYAGIDRHLTDPNATKRYTKAQKLADLHDIDRAIFESLLNVTGQESLIGYTEAVLTLQNGVVFYPLPEGFRQFIRLEFRTSTLTLAHLPSKAHYQERYGVEILTPGRGLRIYPAPALSGDEDWVLIYQRAPGKLHYAKASAVGDKTIHSGVPGTDAGELVLIDDYYNGMEIRIYSAGRGAPQQREIVWYKVMSDTQGVFHVRHPWATTSGDVYYEICPTLSLEYDSIYAFDAAMLTLDQRGHPDRSAALLRHRSNRWKKCLAYAASNVSDRGPARIRPLRPKDRMPTGEIPRGSW